MSTICRALAASHRHNLLAASFVPNISALNRKHRNSSKRKWDGYAHSWSNRQWRLFSNENSISDDANSKLDVTNPTLEWKGASKSNSGFVYHFLASDDDECDKAGITSVTGAVAHALREKRKEVTAVQTDDEAREYMEFVYAPDTEQAARQLVHLGAVWFLPASAPRDPSHGFKPRRLSIEQAETLVLEPGDYLRVHFHPRRFPVQKFDWDAKYSDDQDSLSSENPKRPGVIIAEDVAKGWIVLNKPNLIPVHMTVDNALENAQACLYKARLEATKSQAEREQVYVGIPQRLDQNTSGLFVMATSKRFSSYFAGLLRSKTAAHQKMNNTKRELDNVPGAGHENNEASGDIDSKPVRTGGVHKVYKCLACLMPPNEYARNASLNQWSTAPAPVALSSPAPTDWSVAYAMQFLADSRNNVVRHWLEPSIDAPKRYFVSAPKQPTAEENRRGANMWLESLLKITNVGPPLPLVGNSAAETLAKQLWSGENPDLDPKQRIPEGCRAVVELEIELLTGRTHQIRGQLAAMGFPLVGDVQYGGATPIDATPRIHVEGQNNFVRDSERLALQCSQLEFLDPEEGTVEPEDAVRSNSRSRRRAKEPGYNPPFVPSDRWIRFELKRAWWTLFIEQYEQDIVDEADDAATVSSIDPAFIQQGDESGTEQNAKKGPRPDLLPKGVQLSPGKNKYVLVRAFLPPGSKKVNENDPANYWFVKSATPKECGGPYHGNVAQDLREWIEACGYEVHVTGGGRIDFDPQQNRCVVYGFSYGFGKGNHEWAAKIIQEVTGIPATFDNDDSLY